MNPSVRAFLIAEVLAFVRAAQQVPGVTRIALIGSLTTEKPEPKDADLLVTVTDDADLAPLARLARRLQGRAQSINRGGDVFLTNPKGNSPSSRACRRLGRTRGMVVSRLTSGRQAADDPASRPGVDRTAARPTTTPVGR